MWPAPRQPKRGEMEYKRINVLIPIPLHNEFLTLFPYRGELTAFIRRCLTKAVLYRRSLTTEDVGNVLEGIAKEREDG